ncbi:rsph1, partial [Symbiodinium sp. CCMP2456]
LFLLVPRRRRGSCLDSSVARSRPRSRSHPVPACWGRIFPSGTMPGTRKTSRTWA